MKFAKSIMSALAVAVLTVPLAACDTDRCQTASNPAECRQWSDAGGDIDDYLIGGMAGYAIGRITSGGQQQTYLYRDPGYHGTYRPMHSPIGGRDLQIRRLESKVRAQRAELTRQQAANAAKKREINNLRSAKASSWRFKPSRSSPSSRSSFRKK
ncbi:hypothetical protein [Novosphingobium clariflavum]|uniref:Lipoprotein n=1 Tax=Novosphingobium clariflavum TaxID=2029884 RepID=A0ABV6S1H0_9SPHN|nr:hypothetical protein [Novosphingobium clariflavum]